MYLYRGPTIFVWLENRPYLLSAARGCTKIDTTKACIPLLGCIFGCCTHSMIQDL